MSLKNLTEQEFAALVKRRDRDYVEGVRGTAQRPAMTNWKDSPEANHSPMRKVSGSAINPRLASSPIKYRSKWEASYAAKLELEKRAGVIHRYWYEPFSLWLPGNVRYKPDFLIESPYIPGMERHLEIVEVKGWSKNRRDGMTRLKMAAALFPCFTWRLVWMKKGGGFEGEYL